MIEKQDFEYCYIRLGFEYYFTILTELGEWFWTPALSIENSVDRLAYYFDRIAFSF